MMGHYTTQAGILPNRLLYLGLTGRVPLCQNLEVNLPLYCGFHFTFSPAPRTSPHIRPARAALMEHHPVPTTFAALQASRPAVERPAWAEPERHLGHASGRLPEHTEQLGWAPLHLRPAPQTTLSSSLQGLHARATALACRGVA